MLKTLRCDPALLKKDLNGQTYIVTGANSGTGLATTEQLVRQGAHVIAACRRLEAGKEATKHLSDEPGTVEVMELDLNSLDSVRQFVASFKKQYSKLHGLVNNAGVMNTPEGKTKDGFETQYGVNHLGHFLLTELLLDLLKSSAPSRIICVSSAAHAGMQKTPGTIDLEDLHFERRKYDGVAAYNQSKLAIVIYARNLAKRLKDTGVTAFSTHPGWVRSNLIKHTAPVWVQNIILRPFSRFLGIMSAEDGAQTQLHCLLDDEAPDHSGEYYSQNSVLYAEKKDKPGGWPMKSPNQEVYDDTLAEQLYQSSAEQVSLDNN